MNRLIVITLLSILASWSVGAEEKKVKLVTLAPHIVEMIFELGAGDQIIGTTEHSDFPEAAKSIPRIGNYAGIQVERILEMKPDYILAWKTGNQNQDLKKLESLGIKVIYSEPKLLDHVARDLRLYGKISGHTQQGELQAQAFESRIKKIRERFAGKKTLSGFYELWSRPLTTVAGNAWPQQQMDICGVSNPFREAVSDYPQVGLEQVVKHNPQIIIQPTAHSQADIDAVNWQQWPELEAVKNNALIHPNSDLLHRMTSRMLDGVEQLCLDVDIIRQRYQSLAQ